MPISFPLQETPKNRNLFVILPLGIPGMGKTVFE